MTYVSPAYERIWGRTRASLYESPKSFMESIHPEDREQLLRVVEEHQERAWTCEYRIVRPDGTIRWIHDRGYPILDESGNLRLRTGVSTDITDRKAAEESLHESMELMQYIVRNDPNAIAVYDRDLHYLAVSNRYLLDYNVKEEDIIGKHHYEVFPEMPQRWKDVHQRCLLGAVESEDDDYFERPDGSVTYNRWECRPWYRSSGEIGGIITYTEVTTERKKAEKELRESRERLQIVLDTIPAGVFWKDRDSVYLGANRAWLEAAGLNSSQEVVGKTDYDLPWGERSGEFLSRARPEGYGIRYSRIRHY